MGIEAYRKAAKDLIDWICDYYARVEKLPVRSEVEPGYLPPLMPRKAPDAPEGVEAVMSDIKSKILPGLTHWQSPNFFAFFPANSSFPAMLGDMLSGALSVMGFLWSGSPAATELETIVLDWLAKLLNLPSCFLAYGPDGNLGRGGGVIQGTASETVLVALLAAQARVMAERPAEDRQRLVCYSSNQAHSSIKKACMVAGTTHCRLILARPELDYALDPADLSAAIDKDIASGLIPFYLVGTIGSTSSCAVDPIADLAAIARKHSMWFHIDAAFAGVTAMLPEMQHYFAGLELADSFNTNAHKWLLTNFDCSCMWVQDAEPLKAALSLMPAFLRAKGNAYDFKDWQIPLGRRFRSLKLFFVLRMYGKHKLQQYLRHHIALGELFAGLVRKDNRFEIVTPPRFALTCFVLKGPLGNETAALVDAVNQSGRAFMISTELSGQTVARFAIGGAQTQQRHVRAAWQLICEAADGLLATARAET
ncbi:hypothetical protein CVIRNUC_004931 [Coccomyxa viridis]|uniref:Aromatic-L-amino-acid decarboxylase n=1 Tax=Coccomyxa viridis TaxID=1274662 RepID=A0AAV1I7F6_9CHLO|nr:hypothetical protein CVIRNUC_004931 [Coccomyxa viridis]